MTFAEKLNEYVKLLKINYSNLAKTAGISSSALGRYKTGEREPSCDSVQLTKIVSALAYYARERHISLTEDQIRQDLTETIGNRLGIDYETYLQKLNLLLKTLEIRGGVLARALNFDPSYISKLLSNQRKPANVVFFTNEVATYVAEHFHDAQGIRLISNLLEIDADSLKTQRDIRNAVIGWLGSNIKTEQKNPLVQFLGKMDDFNIDKYLKSVSFDTITLPEYDVPEHTENYTGLDGMIKSEIEFIRATLNSESTRDCILYSDMPIEEMAKRRNFYKQWMIGMTLMLKKGLHLNIIHDVYRPFQEMLLGLESYIPFYMTGQISPYYLPNAENKIFMHLLKSSGGAALAGEAITGHHAEGRYTICTSGEDLAYYQLRAQMLLSKSEPLMDIYPGSRRIEYNEMLRQMWSQDDRKAVYCTLPLYTISRELLSNIMERNHIPYSDASAIEELQLEMTEKVCDLLKRNSISISVPDLSKEAFEADPLDLSLSSLFYNTDISYTYDEYKQHLEQTKDFANRHGIVLELEKHPTFRNISYTTIGDKAVIVSKNRAPKIHFLIRHKKMVRAFRNFFPPISD